MSDNLLFHRGGAALARTRRLCERTRVALHGVALNIASADELDLEYIHELGRLRETLGAELVSDHLCFTRSGGVSSYELLPIARHRRYLEHVAERTQRVQDILRRPLVLENVSAYVEMRGSEMSEGEFFSDLARRTGCGVLLDVNNLFVNAVNFGFDAKVELSRFPLSAVRQIHVAGHSVRDGYLFDTHDQPAAAPVIELLGAALAKVPPGTPVIIERDDADCPLEAVLDELERLRSAVGEPRPKEQIRTQDHLDARPF